MTNRRFTQYTSGIDRSTRQRIQAAVERSQTPQPATQQPPMHPADRIEREALNVHTATDRQCDQIRRDPELTDAAKRMKIGATWLRANEQLRQLYRQLQAERAAETQQWERAAYGVPGDTDGAEYRAALDRVEQIADQDEALHQLERARRIDDAPTIKALGMTALDKGWRAVSQRVSEMIPQQAEALRRLNPDRTTRNRDRWRDSMIYDELPKPPELQRVPDVKDYVERWPESAQSWHPGATL